LQNPHADWPDRTLVTHVGRWPRGKIAEAKFTNCSIRDARFTLVNNAELYHLKDDPGESRNVLAEHPDVAARLRSAYEAWWREILPHLENEDAIGPKSNPFKDRYWAQFGGGPDPALRDRMDPAKVGK
jgi:arylsulfatase